MSVRSGSEAAGHRVEPAPSASDRAYAFVKDQIISGAYAGGVLISEGEVSGAMGISRTPVREAFLRLSVEGLLRLYPKRGALVVPVSAAEIRDVLDARLLVERHAAEIVIAAGRHHAVAELLRAVVAEQSDDDTARDAGRFTDLDRRFHSALVEAAGNRILTDFYGSLRDRQLRMGTIALQRDPARYDAIRAEHTALADLVDAGELGAVVEAMAEHLAGTRAAAGLG